MNLHVKWKEHMPISLQENMMNWCPDDYNPNDFVVHQRGQVIATTRGIFGDTYFTVLCDDGKIRECLTKKAEVYTPNN